MVGWLAEEERKGRRTVLERTGVAGLTVLRAGVPLPQALRERTALRRLERAAERLVRAGVRRALTRPDFPRWEVLEAYGLRPVDPGPLCQALAAPLALAALERQGIPPAAGTVALSGRRVSRPLFQAAMVLCPQVRTLVIDAPDGGAELAQELRREYGAAALTGRGGQLAQVRLSFSPGEGEGLRLWGPAPELDGLELVPAAELPAGLAPLPLLALLWEEGRISAKNIQIIPADFEKTPFQDQDKNSGNFTNGKMNGIWS